MDNLEIYSKYSITEATLLRKTTSFWETTSTAESNRSKR